MKNVPLLLIALLISSCSTTDNAKVNSSKSKEAVKAVVKESKKEEKIILFFGNSITAGYQLDIDQAFPALIQKRLDSLGLNYKTINAGLSGETSAGGMNRIGWVLKTTPDIFFLELGANDGLRGLSLEETPKNLQSIIDAVRKVNPEVKIIIAGMMVPPNLGDGYTSAFTKIFPNLAQKNNATYIPFLLEGVAGDPSLNLSDGIHPTSEGHEIVSKTVWRHLFPLLENED